MPVLIWDYHSCEIEKKITEALPRRQKVLDVIMGNDLTAARAA